MKKTADEIREIAGWVAATDIGLLELRLPGATVRLGRRGDAVVALEEAERPTDSVTACSVGVYLQSHPDSPTPLLRVGDRVQAGQTLGLLRIGVLLLPVTASRPGIVAALRAADGATVGYGAALVDLHPL